MSLALWYIYIGTAIGLVSIPIMVGEYHTFSGGVMSFTIFMNILEAWAVYSLWQSSGLEARTSVLVVLWALELVYIFYAIYLSNGTIYYSALRGVISAAAGVATVVGASFLAFG